MYTVICGSYFNHLISYVDFGCYNVTSGPQKRKPVQEPLHFLLYPSCIDVNSFGRVLFEETRKKNNTKSDYYSVLDYYGSINQSLNRSPLVE